ncbi:MAG: Rieske (2Fe-2S) protein [Verrucomicrobia bacterium]|nr:Rieske (2Fe-2S) protein [Verrucomicrobiota bacterium]
MSESPMAEYGSKSKVEIFTRRTFVRWALGSAGICYAAALGYPVYRYLASPVEKASVSSSVTEVILKDAQNLPKGSVLMFKFGSKPTMLIHHPDGAWSALTAVCTHLGCTVQYQPEKNQIYCACHGGVYDPVTGRNISGPPPKPLMQYRVNVSDAGVVVSRG